MVIIVERFEYHADIKNNFPGHSHENLRKVVYIAECVSYTLAEML